VRIDHRHQHDESRRDEAFVRDAVFRRSEAFVHDALLRRVASTRSALSGTRTFHFVWVTITLRDRCCVRSRSVTVRMRSRKFVHKAFFSRRDSSVSVAAN
jgi:hypothetical protein